MSLACVCIYRYKIPNSGGWVKEGNNAARKIVLGRRIWAFVHGDVTVDEFGHLFY